MALRTIRLQGDPVLEKKCKEIKEITPKIEELIDDKKDAPFFRYGSAHARIYSPHTASASPSMKLMG